MSKIDEVVRSWKDEEFRRSLSGDQLAQLPEHPAGLIDLSEEKLLEVAGGATWHWLSFGCPYEPTWNTGCGSDTYTMKCK